MSKTVPITLSSTLQTRPSFPPSSESCLPRKLSDFTNSFGITSFADHHQLTTIESYGFENHRGEAHTTVTPPYFHALTWNRFCNPFVFTLMHVMGYTPLRLVSLRLKDSHSPLPDDQSALPFPLSPLSTFNCRSKIPTRSGLSTDFFFTGHGPRNTGHSS